MSVGDIQSTERGSAARFNDGKPPLELIPLDIIGKYAIRQSAIEYGDALVALGEFQRGGEVWHLYRIIELLGAPWEDCAAVFDYGRKKYAAWNWAKGMAWSIPIACAARHLLAIIRGDETDPESGLPHRGHVMCNLVMLLTFIETYPKGDDRPVMWLCTKPSDDNWGAPFRYSAENLRAMFEAGKLAEREACAKVCDKIAGADLYGQAGEAADAIRMRSNDESNRTPREADGESDDGCRRSG